MLKKDIYVETRSGKKMYFNDPDVDSIDISDIAYALANQCRFNGHVPFYSVAEHSVYVSGLVEPKDQFAALMHDAAEAYIGDFPSPLKALLPGIKKIEDGILQCINLRFGIVDSNKKEIKRADLQQLRTEAYNFLPSKGEDWEFWKHLEPFDPHAGYRPQCLPPQYAYEMFMDKFRMLTNEGTYSGRIEGTDSSHHGRIILP